MGIEGGSGGGGEDEEGEVDVLRYHGQARVGARRVGEVA